MREYTKSDSPFQVAGRGGGGWGRGVGEDTCFIILFIRMTVHSIDYTVIGRLRFFRGPTKERQANLFGPHGRQPGEARRLPLNYALDQPMPTG